MDSGWVLLRGWPAASRQALSVSKHYSAAAGCYSLQIRSRLLLVRRDSRMSRAQGDPTQAASCTWVRGEKGCNSRQNASMPGL